MDEGCFLDFCCPVIFCRKMCEAAVLESLLVPVELLLCTIAEVLGPAGYKRNMYQSQWHCVFWEDLLSKGIICIHVKVHKSTSSYDHVFPSFPDSTGANCYPPGN